MSASLIPAEIINSTDKAKGFYSTRNGGVSADCYGTLNLSWRGADLPQNIEANYKAACTAMDVDPDTLVFAAQTHSKNVAKVDASHAHRGLFAKAAIPDVDALITDTKGITLTSRTADCVPVLVLDTKHNCIAAIHSGWRGTLQSITTETLWCMQKEYGTDTRDCVVSVGPCICKDCFEVDADVAEDFSVKFGEKYCSFDGRKYHIDLVSIIVDELISLGVPNGGISLSENICTACNTDTFFSHRAEKGKTGGMCAFLTLL